MRLQRLGCQQQVCWCHDQTANAYTGAGNASSHGLQTRRIGSYCSHCGCVIYAADLDRDFTLDYCPRCGEAMVGQGHECGENYSDDKG
jgi:predicted RNA-binding Zn-ribbon protein involved in translation (DUF1610 family)